MPPNRPLTAPGRRPVAIAPVRPNVGLRMSYQKRLDGLIHRMQASVHKTVMAQYRERPPEAIAADESPTAAMTAAMNRLGAEWERRFAEFASREGPWFGRATKDAADRSFAAGLKAAGFTVKFQMTPAVNDIMRATIAEQVNLIKSIPAQYLTQVRGDVMRAVQVGGDDGALSTALEEQYGVTKRRAAIIARDQSAKATASVTRARQAELGITEAIWLHSLGGRKPRPEHLAFNGKKYDIAKGAYLEGVWTWPGWMPNCRCVSKPIIPGLEAF